jgi:hypothetical protein
MALMMSLTESIIQGLPGVGILIGGALAALAGPRSALGLGAFGSIATGFAVWLTLRRAGQPSVETVSPEPAEATPVAS